MEKHLFMLEAGAAAGAGRDFLWGIEELLLQPSVQLLEVLWTRRSLVVQLVPPDVVVALWCLPLVPLQSGCMVVVVVIMVTAIVGVAVRLYFVMLVGVRHGVAVVVLVPIVVVMVVMEMVIAGGLLGVQWGPLTRWSCAVLPHLVHKEDFGHVVDDEHLCPVRNRLGLSTTEMNVHDEDGERGGGCDHSHGGDVVLS